MVNSIKLYLKAITKDPHAILNYVIWGRDQMLRRQLEKVLETDVEKFYEEFKAMKDFHLSISNIIETQPQVHISAPRELYAIIRAVKPKVVVETGVGAGVSSAYILLALRKNGAGMLYSIDLPDKSILRGHKPGYAVPYELRKGWFLVLGPSKEKLPNLLSMLGGIDIFLHDSEHTYENMTFEFQTSFPYIKDGGMLISHDIHFNKAFDDFCKRVKRKPVKLWTTGLGIVRK